eukprot:gene9390-biopygen9256
MVRRTNLHSTWTHVTRTVHGNSIWTAAAVSGEEGGAAQVRQHCAAAWGEHARGVEHAQAAPSRSNGPLVSPVSGPGGRCAETPRGEAPPPQQAGQTLTRIL